jgi:hypothetical protein
VVAAAELQQSSKDARLREFFWQRRFFFFRGVGLWAATGKGNLARRVHRVGMCRVGEKKISFLAKGFSKFRFFGTS